MNKGLVATVKRTKTQKGKREEEEIDKNGERMRTGRGERRMIRM